MTLLEVEEVLKRASVGIWNIKIVFMFCISCLMSGTAPMFYPIAFAEMDFFCSEDDSEKNACFYNNNQSATARCSEYTFIKDTFESTARVDFNLVCGRESYADLDISLMLIAQCISVTLGNFLMDAFGRKPVFTVSCWLATLCSFGYLISPNIQILLFLRFIDCCALISLTCSGFLMMVEDLPLKYSVFATNSSSYMYGTGFSLCALVSYFFRTWKMYVIVRMAIPGLITALLCLFLIDESPRWLLQKKRIDEFESVVNKLFTQNRKEMPLFLKQEISAMREQSNPKTDTISVLELLRTKISNVKFWELYGTGKTATWMGVFALSWIGCVVVYFGMQFGKELFGGVQIHFYFMISGIAEIPGALFQLYVAKKWGRKPANIISFTFCALSLLVSPFIPRRGYWIIFIYLTAFSTKIFISAAFTNIYMWNAEILPTNLRGVGIGLGSFCGRIVGIPLPYVKKLAKIWSPLPAILFATVAFAAAISSVLVPETRNQISPDDMEEFQAFGTNKYIELKQKRMAILNTTKESNA